MLRLIFFFLPFQHERRGSDSNDIDCHNDRQRMSTVHSRRKDASTAVDEHDAVSLNAAFRDSCDIGSVRLHRCLVFLRILLRNALLRIERQVLQGDCIAVLQPYVSCCPAACVSLQELRVLLSVLPFLLQDNFPSFKMSGVLNFNKPSE